MSKPWVHAESSARLFGGKPEDYISLHNLMDSSKGTIADSRHRALTHNSWFIAPDGPLERIFGVNLTNSDGRLVSVRELGEQHILEDFGNRFIPSAQDYLQEINIKEWMVQGKGVPPSFALIFQTTKKVIRKTMDIFKPTEQPVVNELPDEEIFLDGVSDYRTDPDAIQEIVDAANSGKSNKFLLD